MPKSTARGLLVDDQYIEVLEIKSDGRGLKVSNYNWRKLPEGVISRGRVVRRQALAQELIPLINEAQQGPISGPMVLGLPQEQVFIKIFSMPQFAEKDLDEAINWHISSLGPVVPREAYTAHEIIGKNNHQELTVLLAAAAKDVVDDYLAAADLAGISLEAVEPITIARVRLIDPKQISRQTVLMVNLSAGQLTIIILVNGKLWFSKDSKLKEYNQLEIAQLTGELINFFQERKEINVAAIGSIIYSGDKSGLTVLPTALSGFKLPLTLIRPGWHLVASKIFPRIEPMGLAPVLGLALAGRLEERELLSLMPDWPKQKAKGQSLARISARLMVTLGLLAVLIMLILAGGWWWLKQSSRNLHQETLIRQTQLNQDEGIIEWATEFNQTVARINQIEKKRLSQAEILRQLASLTPLGVKITALTANFMQDNWLVSGVAENRESVLVFYDQLKSSQWFNRAKLYFSSLQSNQGVVFRLSGGKK